MSSSTIRTLQYVLYNTYILTRKFCDTLYLNELSQHKVSQKLHINVLIGGSLYGATRTAYKTVLSILLSHT